MTGKLHISHRRVLLASCAVLAFSTALPVRAQTASNSQSSGIETVIVTAQKRSENVQNVPSTVSVVGAQQLQQLHAVQLTDIGAYVPGLQIDSQGAPGLASVTIRGIAPLSSTASVGTYIDEAPLGASSGVAARAGAQALDILPYDVERIEVLEGPQGTLYGANSLGGLIKYVLTTPSLDDTEVRLGGDILGISGGNSLGGGARFTVDTPLVDGKLGIIASGAFENTPGYIDNSQTGQKNQNPSQNQSARVGLLYQPNDDLSIKINGLYQHIDAKNIAAIALDPTTLRPLSGDLTENNVIPYEFTRQFELLTADINWDLHWATFVSASSYSYDKDVQTVDYTPEFADAFTLLAGAPPDNRVRFPIAITLKKYSQEFRLASPSDAKLEWVIGTFLDYEQGTNSQDVYDETATGTPIPGQYPAVVISLPSIYREYAVFGSATYHFTDRFDVAAGVRYAKNVQSFRQIFNNSILAPASNDPGYSSEDVLTYSVNPRFHITDDIMAYARVATGYQVGGPNIAFPGVPPAQKSSTLTNYEAGVKSTFWDDRAVLNASIFDLEWDSIQINAITPNGITYGANGGTARSRGFEASGTVDVTSGLQLSGQVTYTDAIFTQAVPALNATNGSKIPLTPEWAGAITADYTWTLSTNWNAHIGAGLRLVGDRFSSGPSLVNEYKTPAYTALDANMDVSNDRYTIRLFAKNLTDERGYLSDYALPNAVFGTVSQVQGVIIQPRTIGLSLDVKL